MREFMRHITEAYFDATGWTEDNSYKELNATSRDVIDFGLPHGLRFTLSSLATPHFATSYQLGTVGLVDGFISYLYSSVPLGNVVAPSARIPLSTFLRSYRELHDLGLQRPQDKPESAASQVTEPVMRTDSSQRRNSLLYGRIYLPQSLLEGLMIKRFSPGFQLQISGVSDRALRNGGTLLGLAQYDRGNFGVEGLASTDGGLLGIRGLYNFGGDASPPAPTDESGSSSNSNAAQLADKDRDRIYGRFSAGGEMYYGTLNKSGGVSLGTRFATLPAHRGTPLTATLTINPLMGNISATYAVVAREYCTLATRMEFNVYSYESEWAVGMEVWSGQKRTAFRPESRPPLQHAPKKERSFQAKLEWRLDENEPVGNTEDTGTGAEQKAEESPPNEYFGVLKARLDQNSRIGLVWEGRVKSLIFSLGAGIDLRKLGDPVKSLGMEIQYSS